MDGFVDVVNGVGMVHDTGSVAEASAIAMSTYGFILRYLLTIFDYRSSIHVYLCFRFWSL